jgi:hypothetical protein
MAGFRSTVQEAMTTAATVARSAHVPMPLSRRANNTSPVVERSSI